jgi:copper ion binding protein
MTEQTISVAGMTCGGCVNSVTRAIKALPGIASVEVSLEQKSANVLFDESQTTLEAIRAAVIDAGYEVPVQ